MNVKTQALSFAAVLFAAMLIAPATASADPAAAGPALRDCAGCFAAREHRGQRAPGRRMRLALAARNDPAFAVVRNLRAIERVYRRERREAELPAMYRDVLARTNDALIRNFVHYRLARLEMRDGDARGALDALRRNLDENLQRMR